MTSHHLTIFPSIFVAMIFSATAFGQTADSPRSKVETERRGDKYEHEKWNRDNMSKAGPPYNTGYGRSRNAFKPTSVDKKLLDPPQ